jgi:hypothetical protein
VDLANGHRADAPAGPVPALRLAGGAEPAAQDGPGR